MDQKLKTVLIALDLTREVLNQARKINAQLVVTHHPLIFEPVKSILMPSLLCEVINAKISVICAHTNLDVAEQGVSFNLAVALGLQSIEILPNSDNFGRIGFLSHGLSCDQFLKFVSNKLGAVVKATKFSGLISRVAVVSGAGGSFLKAALKSKTHAFVTGECKHSDFVDALNENVCLVAAGHFETENLICEVLQNRLAKVFGEVKFCIADNCKPVHSFCGDLKWL